MSELQVQDEVKPLNCPSGHHEFEGLQKDLSSEETGCMESLRYPGHGEVEESLLLLADVALAPPCGDVRSCVELESSLHSLQLQLQFLISKADDLQDCLLSGQGQLKGESLTAAVPVFLYTCQPYFNHLESIARGTESLLTLLPVDIYTRIKYRVQLLDFSQQLCDRLQQLLLTYASHSLLCLDETEPNSVSHFCIGQSQLGRLRLTTFFYCKPAPYLAQVDTGLYKRMRWNVDRLGEEKQQRADEDEQGEENEEETVGDTEYYFLCYEELPIAEVDKENEDVSHCDVVRSWSIGQWVQTTPDPDTEDIYDWILCDVPQASYQKLLLLGSEEPSSCCATDYMQQLLLSRQTAEGC